MLHMQSQIFDPEYERKEALLKKYTRKVRTARVLCYSMLGLALLAYVTTAFIKNDYGMSLDSRDVYQIVFVTGMLIVTGLSHIRPVVPLIIMSVFTAFGTLVMAMANISIIYYSVNSDAGTIVAKLASMLVGVAITYFVTDGAIAAWKYRKLRKSISMNGF